MSEPRNLAEIGQRLGPDKVSGTDVTHNDARKSISVPDTFFSFTESLNEWREKGSSLNSTCVTPKPLAPSVYVHAPQAHSPHERSMSVMSLFSSPIRLPNIPISARMTEQLRHNFNPGFTLWLPIPASPP